MVTNEVEQEEEEQENEGASKRTNEVQEIKKELPEVKKKK